MSAMLYMTYVKICLTFTWGNSGSERGHNLPVLHGSKVESAHEQGSLSVKCVLLLHMGLQGRVSTVNEHS